MVPDRMDAVTRSLQPTTSMIRQVWAEYWRRIVWFGVPAFVIIFLTPLPLIAKLIGIAAALLVGLIAVSIELLVIRRREVSSSGIVDDDANPRI
jgi:hypothetical protein